MVKIHQAFFFIFLIEKVNCFSEEQKERSQTIFLEGCGGGLFYSVNYENLLIRIKEKVRLGLRFGYSANPFLKQGELINHFMFCFPCVLGRDVVKAELTFCYTLFHTPYRESTKFTNFYIPGIGFRIHEKFGKFNFRLGFSPLIIPEGLIFNNPVFMAFGYISFGYSF